MMIAMSVRDGLLALLRDGPTHGYQLKVNFDEAAGDTWHLNIGQVYTTLQRLERDDLVTDSGVDDQDRTIYQLTDEGATKAEAWFSTPVERNAGSRDEVSLKLLIAAMDETVELVDVLAVQRTGTMRALQDFTALRADHDDDDFRWTLHLDRLIFLAEAELRWIDRTEERLKRKPVDKRKDSVDAPRAAKRQPSI